jgi:hypothetical protein
MMNRADQNWPDEMITEIEDGNCSGGMEGLPITTLAAEFFMSLYDRPCVRTLTVNQGEGL